MSRRFTLIRYPILILVAALWSSQIFASNIAGTKHNLSVTGPGSFKASAEQRVCVFCHTPHNADPADPLWNHVSSGSNYTPYSSETMAQAAPGQPAGTSKLCLSCHDGTIALGSVHNLPENAGPGVIAGLSSALTGDAHLSTDLSDDHPISFTYDAALVVKNTELVDPVIAANSLPLYGAAKDQVECASCHNPHESTNPKFLRKGYTESGVGSPLCLTCHDKQFWTASSHYNSTATWNGAGTNPWHLEGHNLANDAANSTPKANGCENCHKPHDGGGGQFLLKQDGESAVCLVCHNGNVASTDIDSAMNMMYVHPSKTTNGSHNPTRDPADNKVREPQADLNNRHAECSDCHNPHAAQPGVSPNPGSGQPTTNLASGVLKGVWGVEPNWPGNWGILAQNGDYTEVDDITHQYQLCLKCHSSYAFGLTPPADPYNKIPAANNLLTDQAQEFNPNNASFHPVVTDAQSRNDFVMTRNGTHDYSSSLINGQSPTSVIGCTDCHSNSDSNIKGPHGSNVWPLLWGPYTQYTGRRNTGDHICFRCHDFNVYGDGGGDNDSNWTVTGFSDGQKNLHKYHVVKKDMPCMGCHSAIPHGWKRKHFLVYGVGIKDPAPYNAHDVYQVDGSSNYGIHSNTPVDTIQSGYWEQDVCHDGNRDVGDCG